MDPLMIIAWLMVVGYAGILAVSLSEHTWRTFLFNRRSRIAKEAEERLRKRLSSDAWWFAEHKPTMALLQDLAQGYPIAEAHDRWQARRRRITEDAVYDKTAAPARLARRDA